MLISEDSARASRHANEIEMPTIIVSPGRHSPLNPRSEHDDDNDTSDAPATTRGRPNFMAATILNERAVLMRQAFVNKDTTMATSEARAEELLAFHEDRTSWRVYRTLCRLRFGYLAFLVLMIVLMFSFTLLMEIFFAIFLPSARTFSTEYVVRSVILLALLPIVLFFLSYFFEEATRFFFDAITKTDGGLPNFRLAVAVVIHYVRNRSTFKARAATAEAARRASQHSDNGGADDDDDDDDAAGAMRLARNTLFLTAKDDPFFVDEDEKEDHEEIKEQVQEWEASQSEQQDNQDDNQADATALELGAALAPSPARRRWKRVGAAVMATNLMKHTHLEGPAIELTTFLVVDFLCPVLFELLTTVVFFIELLDSWSPYAAFLTYVRNGFYLVSVYVVVWMGCHFWSSRNAHMRLLVSHYRRKRRRLQKEVRSLQREKQSEQLWLLDVGFRFYHHIGVFLNPLAWIRRRSATRAAACGNTNGSIDDGHVALQTGNAQATAAAASSSVSVGVQDASDTTTLHGATDANTTTTSGFATHVATRLQNIRDARATLRAKNPWRRLALGTQAWILLGVCSATALISLWSFMVGWPLMGVSLILLSNVTQRRFPQIFGNTFRHFITAFVVLSLIFFSSTVIIGTFVTGGSFQLGPPTKDTLENAVVASAKLAVPVSQTIEYPVCSIDYDGLTVLDLALIADAAYGSTPEIQQASLRNRFNGTELDDWEVVAHSDATEHQVWMEIYFPSLNKTVLAVRGTASAADALEDLHYWFGITTMQAVNVFVPFLKQLPHDFVVSLLSMKVISSLMPPPVFEKLLRHARHVRQRVGGDQLVVTGHSLGGAMAAMVGARVKAQAVSFSGPGLLYSRGRFDVEAQDVRDYVLTLKPQKDIVPQVDKLGGMVQELRCRHKSPMKCHSTDTHMCELYLACGDARERNWSRNLQCNNYRALPVSTSSAD